ncbi:MucBP domain-containing protein [Levilactobacillus angrenensis]|uniref:MucBP domain-containing protein n=1 Tax=Levilactobacillus angrenensis TaxID=2486020 RepID=A0ABW1UCZ1_9LACO|nr:MucBP domain-containing protein [Levilactobacillus angrenensis]
MLRTVASKRQMEMMKRGRTWVFASLVTATLAVGVGQVTAQADESPTPVAPTAATGAASQQDSTVTLTPAATQSADEDPAVANADATTMVDENESADTNNVISDVATPAPAADEAIDPVATDKTTTDTSAVTDAEPTTTTPADTKPVAISAPAAQPATATKTVTGAAPQLKAVKLVKAEVAKPATVKLAHQQKAATIDEWMPNTVLQQAVLKALRTQNPSQSWASAADITQADMALLKSLSIQTGAGTYIDGKTDFKLDGLEFATNLTSFYAGGNLDGEPGAYYGDIADVTPLAGLEKLTTLDLQHNRITNVAPLAGLKNLQTLYLSYNRIQDFSVLKGNSYQKFHAGSQAVVLDPVKVSASKRAAQLKVQFITIDGNVIQLEPAAVRVANPVFYNSSGFTYRFYFTGGTGVSDGQGGLNYTELKDQIPGITEYPGVTVDVQENNYFMTGKAEGNDSYGSYLFVAMQGYDITEEAAAVTVKHQDENGQTLADDVVLPAGMIGEDYQTTPATIKGYKLKTTPANATGKYGTDPITVIYVYEKDDGGTVTPPPVVTPDEDVTLTIYYQLADGTNLAASQTISGQPGTAYMTSPLTIAGYTLVTTPANATGVFGSTDGSIVYVYEKTGDETDGGDGDQVIDGGDGDEITDDGDDVTTDGPTGSVTTADGGAGDTVSGRPINTGQSTTSSPATTPLTTNAPTTTLPQTDERQTSAWWGVALLAVTAVGGWLSKRRRIK